MEEINNKKEFIREVLDENYKPTFKTLLQNQKSFRMFIDDIDECLNTIEFDKIHQAMEVLNWTWYMWKDEWGDVHMNEVPSVYAIKHDARDMFKRFIDWALTEEPFTADENFEYLSSCGGWVLRCNIYGDEEKIYFDLTFALENFSN